MTDSITAIATVVLAVVTTALALFTGGLWRETYKLAKDAKNTSEQQSADSKRSLDIAQEQTALSVKQAEILEKQKEISRLQYFATHRPMLAVRELVLLPPTADDDNTKVRFVIANTGASAGRIVESHFEVQIITGRFMMPLMPMLTRNIIGDVNIEPGSQYTFTYESTTIDELAYHKLDRNTVHQAPEEGDRLFFRGYIVYDDMNKNDITSNGITRRTGICREYNLYRGYFHHYDDPDYEYQD